jgi:hypothetical protein
MKQGAWNLFVLVAIAHVQAGCGGASDPRAPTAPSSVAQPASGTLATAGLIRFVDQASGFSTTDARDADDQIVQFTTAGELIWAADGTRLHGFTARGNTITIPAEASCHCSLVVHFGAGRAYLTADYIHDNPGTIVDLEIVAGALVVNLTGVFPPGTHTLTGTVTEMTDAGPVPVQDVKVWRLNDEETGWRGATTDQNGFYEIRGLYDGSRAASFVKEGYRTVETVVTISGDTRFDVRIVRP